MTTYTITSRVCNGCLRNEHYDDIHIVQSKTRNNALRAPNTIDICEDCVNLDRYICPLCDRVHSDEDPCDELLAANAEALSWTQEHN